MIRSLTPKSFLHGRKRFSLGLVCAAIVMSAALPALGLDASELALVVNRNMPDGMKLAEMYAKARQVPPNRIIELDLPQTEQMSFEVYERDVVPPIRQFLRLNDPQRQVKCLVTFYGVPFRVGAHVDTPQEIEELAALHAQVKDLGDRIHSVVAQAETLAWTLDNSFKPPGPPSSLVPNEPNAELDSRSLDVMTRRIDHAGKSIIVSIQKIKDPAARQTATAQFLALVQKCNGPVDSASSPTTKSSTTRAPATQSAGKESAGKESSGEQPAEPDALVAAMPLEDRRFDPVAREAIRAKSAKSTGLFAYSRLLIAQIAYLSPQDTEAATDSELSLLWWTFYPRPRWQLNTLCYRFASTAATPALMVARLDAPKPEIVRQMILDSVSAEDKGLQGRIVIDARGLPLDGPGGKPDSYALFDDSLRRLAALIHLKTALPLTFDDNPEVLPPHSVQDVALYCGWYSVGKYVPCCSFVPGAVGFHIASFEMVSLRDPSNTGWVRGLINDGVAATIGPVSEPYLQSFPPPDEFFPLLLTGRLTLAEVYWKTEVMASWRMCLVGDPLYRPFKMHPQLKVESLPSPLQPIFATLPNATP